MLCCTIGSIYHPEADDNYHWHIKYKENMSLTEIRTSYLEDYLNVKNGKASPGFLINWLTYLKEVEPLLKQGLKINFIMDHDPDQPKYLIPVSYVK